MDASGREINSNRFIALMAAVVLRQHPGTTIVTDSVTSNGLASFIEKLGGKHMRYVQPKHGLCSIRHGNISVVFLSVLVAHYNLLPVASAAIHQPTMACAFVCLPAESNA